MKKLIFSIAMFILSFSNFAQTSSYVNGYYRSNGTYVCGYYRTTPDYTKDNNYSTIGNINPYTGESGTKTGGLNPSYYSSLSSNYNEPSYVPSNYDYLIPSTSSTCYFTTPAYTPSDYSYLTYDFLNYSTPIYTGF